jgi:hypothetical protein
MATIYLRFIAMTLDDFSLVNVDCTSDVVDVYRS